MKSVFEKKREKREKVATKKYLVYGVPSASCDFGGRTPLLLVRGIV